jgi:PKD repeat protein
MRGRVSLIATLFLLAVLVLPASALQLNGQDVSAEIIGATVEYPVILDEAPAGLSSYNITVTLTDPAVGEITSAEFPAWATENEMSTIPADSVTIQGLDFNEQVQEGATNISLATLTIRADAAGTTPVIITINGMYDEIGGIMSPAIQDGSFTVTEPLVSPVADFIADPASGVEPLTVAFTDLSTGDITGYAWDFENDGVVDSTEQNPGHIYPLAGTYTVNLTVTGPGGSDDEVKVDYITVTAAPVPAPVADFIADPASGVEPLTVAFTDLSTGDITGYAWDFENDGVIDSTEQNPSYIYPLAGTYTVNLTVTGPGGSDDEVEYITVTAAPAPAQVRAEIRIEPETLNLKSSGVFTVFITLPDEYSVTEISADSLVCEGANAKSGKVISGMENEYMAKFQRQDLENVIPGDAVTFTLSGTLNTDAGMVEFVGNEMIRVIE